MKEPSQFISMKFLEAMHHKSHGSDPITVLSHKEKKLAKRNRKKKFKVHFSGFHVAASLTIVTTIDVLLSIIIFYYLFIY